MIPNLSRFLSPDSIIPDLQNILDWDRYQYVRSDPVRLVDPTGHFSKEAIKNYLKGQYKEKWGKYWEKWRTDKSWINLLHKSQSGDILTRLGNGGIEHFQFFGKGEDVLGGIASIAQPGLNPEWTGFGDLNNVFSNKGKGIGVMRFINGGNGIDVRATIGDIGYFPHVVTAEDVDDRNMGIGAMVGAVTAIYNPLVGILASTVANWLSRRVSELPGLSIGDLELTIGTYSSSARWGYQYTFRGGQPISTGAYYQQLPVGPIPHVGP